MANEDLLFNEVDQAVRAERLRSFWQRFGSWIVAACIALVVGTVGFELWKNHREEQNSQATGQILLGLQALEKQQLDTAKGHFTAIESGSQGVKDIADLHLAGIWQQQKDPKAKTIFARLAQQAENPAIRSYAALHSGNWSVFKQQDAPFGNFAAELQATQLIAAQKYAEATALLDQALQDIALPETQRARLTDLKHLAQQKAAQ
jgi:hypothetical protein